MIREPYNFWERQRLFSFPGISCNSILGRFLIFTTDVSITRRILNTNGKDSLLLAVHTAGRRILGKDNLAFMHGPEHKAIRRSLLPLFTRKALSMYVLVQQTVIRRHIEKWIQLGAPHEIRDFAWTVNAETSQEVFVGPYLIDCKQREEFTSSFMDMTSGFTSLPIYFPGTRLWKAVQGRKFIVKLLATAVQRSKARMKEGIEPECLLDFWSTHVLREIEEAQRLGHKIPKHSTDEMMASTLMSFLFASQDASTASIVWTLFLMAKHPDILEKVREEQQSMRDDMDGSITGDLLSRMTYTRQVVKEILRYRPPAAMVPQEVQQSYKISDDYTAPKGSYIMPSIWSATMQGFTDPTKFDPDRMSRERQEDLKFVDNYLTFGCGPHRCIGRDYALNQLIIFLAIVSMQAQWELIPTKKTDLIVYFSTIYPAECILQFYTRATNHEN